MSLIRRMCFFVLLMTCLIQTSCAKDAKTKPAAKEEKPRLTVLHVLAPSKEYARVCDPLMMETTLRLVASEMANRYGVQVHYWPADEIEKIPHDAFPRIEAQKPGTLMMDMGVRAKRGRIKRQGDTFTLSIISQDGTEIMIGRRVMPMPAKVYVGMMINAFYKPDTPYEGIFKDVKLNGKPFEKPTLKDIGTFSKPSTLFEDKGQQKLTTYGYDRNIQLLGKAGEYGPFVYVPCEGDFTIEGTLSSQSIGGIMDGLEPVPIVAGSPKNSSANKLPTKPARSLKTAMQGPPPGRINPMSMIWCYPGLVCRSSDEINATEIGIFCKNDKLIGGWRNADYSYVNWFDTELTSRCANVVLHYQVESEKNWARNYRTKKLSDMRISWASWPELTESAEKLTDDIISSLGKDYELKPVTSAPSTQPLGLPELDKIRPLILSGKTWQILTGARQIDQLLKSHGNDPSIHYLAAMPGAMMACQEFYGFFSDRPRFLATPLTHLMLAKRYGGNTRSQDNLTEAWMALVCGYPASAKSLIEALPDETKNTPEARALKMFVTRDYTPFSETTISEASTIEQMAWSFATFSSGREDLLIDTSVAMAMKKNLASLLPIYNVDDVGLGHSVTSLAMRLAIARDMQVFLTNSELPQELRKNAADEFADIFDLSPQQFLDSKVAYFPLKKIFKTQLPLEMGKNLAPVISALNGLYSAAITKSASLVSDGNSLQWSSMTLHDFADFRRGFLVNLLHRREHFMNWSWGVPDYAYEFSRQAAEGFAGTKELHDFFDIFGRMVHNDPQARNDVWELSQTPFASNPAYDMYMGIPFQCRNTHMMIDKIGSRGSWQWKILYQVEKPSDGLWFADERAAILNDLCYNADPNCFSALKYVLNRSLKLQPVEDLISHMPYNLSLLAYAANRADTMKDWPSEITLLTKAIHLAPKLVGNYYTLAHLYAKLGQRSKAIAVTRQAMKNAPDTVFLSNLQGQTAYWLVQENQPEEALKMGQISSESYSALGLLGLAEALEANQKYDQALRIYRAIAERYEDSAWNLIDFMFRMKYSDEDITLEIKRLLQKHETMKSVVAKSIAEGFRTQGDHLDLLESLFKSELSIVPVQERTPLLLDVSIYSRRFDKTLSYATELVQQKNRPDIVQTLEIYVAMTLMGQTDEAKKCIDEITDYPKDQWLYPHVQYLQGKCTAEQMVSDCDLELDRAYAYWLIGVRAESEKNYPATFSAYEKASHCCTSYMPRRLGKYWPLMIQAKTATTQQLTITQTAKPIEKN